ncbi:ribonuclease H-like protein [Mycena polygramma]|nr:ribonuclease H-like protein [Mycena polygramma]
MENAQAGAGVYFGVGDPRNRAIRVPDEIGPSNQVGEVIAIKEAAELAPYNAPLKIISDSKYAIQGLTKNLRKWEDEGFFTVQNGPLMELTVAKIRERKAKTELEWVKGHTGNAGNEAADVLAGEGSRKPDEDAINTDARAALLLPGAKLQAMTQSLAYKIIRKITIDKPGYRQFLARPKTIENMALAQEAATGTDGEPPLKRAIWKSTRHKDISRSIRFFLWMLIHGGYKVGEYWENIPGHQHKAKCTRCGVYESMEHILTECAVPGQKEVWDLASEMWQKRAGTAMRPTVAEIMAGPATKKGDPATTRLYKILITESAHLIWRLRNERVINEKEPASVTEIHNRWVHQIQIRLSLDCAMTDKLKYEKKAIKMSLVKGTWKKVLKNEHLLSKDWPREVGVLVGIG